MTITRSEMWRTTLRSWAMKTNVSPKSSCRSLSRFRICLDRDVERRDRLVADDQLRVHRQGARDADALPLAAGELVRKAVVVLRVEADDLEQLLHARLDLGRRPSLCTSSGSPMMKPTRLRGFSDAYGSWKIIVISRRMGLIAPASFVMSRPSKVIWPPVGPAA
jgi:hypothetical protein